ncbi:MAG: hypothetical protein FWE41_02430 [Coriobacteriia bacterium]|nr:hypothetical protein [Coriobacteriia bacterium]MCL2750997.1 hypothetical protein [Coriobacteriia bacterium]
MPPPAQVILRYRRDGVGVPGWWYRRDGVGVPLFAEAKSGTPTPSLLYHLCSSVG